MRPNAKLSLAFILTNKSLIITLKDGPVILVRHRGLPGDPEAARG